MHRTFFVTAVGWLLVLPGSEAAAGERAAYTAAQLSLIRATAECQIAPDGKTIAFTSTITGATELWTLPAAGGWPTQLTNLNEDVSDIHWSPDGRWIVFMSDYGGNARPDLFRVPAAGGRVEKLTRTRLVYNEPRLSPDGGRLAFTADPDEPFVFQLHVMDLSTRKVIRLTREKEKVQSIVWSADGKSIALNRSGDDQKGDLLLIDVATGTHNVVRAPGRENNLLPERFSPDGKSVLTTTRNRAGFLQMAVLPLQAASAAGQPPRPAGSLRFIGPGDWDVLWAHWTRRGIYFLRNEDGTTRLWFMPSPDGKPRRLLPSDQSVAQVSLDRSEAHLAFLRGDVTRPADVWVVPDPLNEPDPQANGRQARAPRQVTFSLMGGVRSENLSPGRFVTYPSFDGKKIHALVLRPRVLRLGSPPPAIMYVHGGPNGQISQSFRTIYHVLTEAGFVVIAPNYRGSTGYGKPFEDANNRDWGGGDLKDLVAAVKYFAARGDIDRNRVGITGGSYGGYMTLMALGRTPEIWKAGVELYGMPDLVMDYYLAKTRFADWYHTEMGNPRTDAALFRERSPLLYLDDIKAPLLVFQGAGDTSVPRAESDLLVAVLRELKKDHRYIVYDDEGHGFTRRKNLLDYYGRTAEFFVKHLGPRK
jgi:dipeptidyl aminopeptidase/acylaminoacyl peptidase